MAIHEERECLECGQTFITTNGKQRFCSRKCSKRNLQHRTGQSDPNVMRQGNTFTTEIGYINRVKAFSSRLEYIGRDGEFFYVMCKDCGSAFKRSIVCFKPSHRRSIMCPGCEEIRLKAQRQKEEKERDRKERERKRKQEEKEARAKAKLRTYICFRCGKEFISGRKKKYCSIICGKRQNSTNSEHHRRMRAMSMVHDVISLKELAKRDKNKCWICGQRVDWYDCETREDGTFLAHDNYPSIDHALPLAKGGAHLWSNVRLAHRGCNSKKRTSLTIEESSGQIRLAL